MNLTPRDRAILSAVSQPTEPVSVCLRALTTALADLRSVGDHAGRLGARCAVIAEDIDRVEDHQAAIELAAERAGWALAEVRDAVIREQATFAVAASGYRVLGMAPEDLPAGILRPTDGAVWTPDTRLQLDTDDPETAWLMMAAYAPHLGTWRMPSGAVR